MCTMCERPSINNIDDLLEARTPAARNHHQLDDFPLSETRRYCIRSSRCIRNGIA